MKNFPTRFNVPFKFTFSITSITLLDNVMSINNIYVARSSIIRVD